MAYLTAEMFVSAGPRKSRAAGNGDSELGEDCCNCVITRDLAYVVIADGTSDQESIRLPDSRVKFSSRLLAQTVTACVGNALGDMALDEASDSELITRVESAWSASEALWKEWLQDAEECTQAAHINSAQYVSQLFEERPQFVSFSTTLLIAALSVSGKAMIANFGDSVWVVKHNSGNYVTYKNLTPGRLSMRLCVNADSLSIVANAMEPAGVKRLTEVSFIAAGSDGVGRLPELIIAQGSTQPRSEFMRRLLRYAPQTGDDKLFCLVARHDGL